ncbi:type I glyceraldehyde-3-phosphate dehydrogenase [Pseudonocardia benzenivorans]|uniref:Type I glyceraldehyde-3-phosphate dehydrogenase n=1 Tax=Pseudonocardia benzenivorans TaxID=228005 RepID=A0ABW3VRH9_9PSEU
MRTRVGVNAMGRIGRALFRIAEDRAGCSFEIVAANDVAGAEQIAGLLARDSTYGRWDKRIELSHGYLSVDDRAVRVTQWHDPTDVDWSEDGVEIVVDATGRFRTRDAAAAHLSSGVRKVVLTAPGSGMDATIVMGVNDSDYEATRDHVLSAASCTTNCAAPMAYVLDQAFGIEEGLMTTVHSYTADQNLVDGPHHDPRRARSAAVNIIPTGTGAATAVGAVLPRLAGRLDGLSLRVPVEDVSLVDLTVRLSTPVTAAQVNHSFVTAADGALKGVLRCTTEPIVSRDVVGERASCLMDLGLTRVVEGLVKVFGWYDNEWGYAERVADLLGLVARTLPDE